MWFDSLAAVVTGYSHYNLIASPEVPQIVVAAMIEQFLDAPMPDATEN